MIVAFDARETSHMSHGVLTYARRLREWLPQIAPDLQLVAVGSGDNFDLAEQVALPLELVRTRAALAHFPTLYVPRVIPVPYVVTIHDLIDMHEPQYVKRYVRPYLRAVVAPVARGARAVITDDDATVADLQRFLGVDPGRVRVIPLGSDEVVEPVEPMRRPRPYLLYVTNRRPHKNIATLVRAWESLPAEREIDLILSGTDDGSVRGTRERGTIVHLGHVSDGDLQRWYAGAAAYVHPSLREGFGLPLLEAMRYGAPVVAARSSLPRVLAPYAYGVDPRDALAFRAALLEVLDDPAAAGARARTAREATRALTWERTARLTADVYREFAR